MARGKVIDMNKETKKVILQISKGEEEFTVGKGIFNEKKFEVGDTIEYNMRGKNFEFVRKVFEEEQRRTSQKPKSFSTPKTNKSSSIFTYPYNFVSLGKEIEKSDIKLGVNSGKLKCTLVNYSPIFTGGEKSQSNKHTTELFLEDDSNYIISASSLKGEIRNIIEAITHSCIRSKSDKIPDGFEKYNSIKKLCFACRLFGATVEDSAYSGRVFFTDAKLPKLDGKNRTKRIILKPLGEPREDLAKYYLNNGEIRGRKFYWHHEEKLGKNRDYSAIEDTKEKNTNTTIHILESMKEFSFEVVFKNLTDVELGMLIYSLELEKGLLHKIGRGKALGLGSCKITIKSFELDGENKYDFSSLVSKMKKIDKKIYLDKIEGLYLKNNSQMEQLRVILKEKNIFEFGNAYQRRTTNRGKMPEILTYKK